MPRLSVAVEFDSDWTIVSEIHFHHRPELAVCDVFSPVQFPDLLDKIFIECLGLCCPHTVVKIRLVSFQDSVQSKLAHEHDLELVVFHARAPGLRGVRQSRPESKIEELVCNVVAVFLCIMHMAANEDTQSSGNARNYIASNNNLRSKHPLDHHALHAA